MLRTVPLVEACCTPLGPAPVSADEAERMAAALRVLADPARLRIVSLLATTAEACGCDLIGPLGLSQPTVSHHLKVLHEAGLLEREQRGKWAFYRLRRAPLEALSSAIAG